MFLFKENDSTIHDLEKYYRTGVGQKPKICKGPLGEG